MVKSLWYSFAIQLIVHNQRDISTPEMVRPIPFIIPHSRNTFSHLATSQRSEFTVGAVNYT